MNVGDRLKESNNINTTLLVLGRCISTVRDGQIDNKESSMPPFRDSKLTQLFQNALMGKENIIMMVNINPSRETFDETHHALNFSAIAKEIIRNEPPPKPLPRNRFSCYIERKSMLEEKEDENEDDIRALRDEIANLVLRLSELREEKEEELEMERQHLRSMFGEIIKYKDKHIGSLKAENQKLIEEKKKLIEEKKELEDVTTSDDEASDEYENYLRDLATANSSLSTELKGPEEVITISDEEPNDDEYENQLTNLANENNGLKTDLKNKVMEIETLRNQLRDKDQQILEKNMILSDAEDLLKLLQESNEQLRKQCLEYKNKILMSDETLNAYKEEINNLTLRNRILVEESERSKEDGEIYKEEMNNLILNNHILLEESEYCREASEIYKEEMKNLKEESEIPKRNMNDLTVDNNLVEKSELCKEESKIYKEKLNNLTLNNIFLADERVHYKESEVYKEEINNLALSNLIFLGSGEDNEESEIYKEDMDNRILVGEREHCKEQSETFDEERILNYSN